MRGNSPRSHRFVVVVTGTPGTGKTTISKLLTSHLHANYLSLNERIIARKLYSKIDRDRRTRIVDLHRSQEYLENQLKKAQPVTLIDTHVIEAIPRKYVKKVIVLRCHPKILQARLHRKGWSHAKIRENVLAEVLDACYASAVYYCGKERVVQVNTSRSSAQSCANKIERILRNEATGDVKVDWLSKTERDRSLKSFLE